jgi:ribonuclease G
MSTELIINGSLPETRIALTENGEIQELLIERASGKGIVGNIYKGRVTRVLPGMQAAFVDIGLEKAAFLYVDDVFVHSEVWEEEEAASEDAESLPVLTGGEHAVAAEQVAEAATESAPQAETPAEEEDSDADADDFADDFDDEEEDEDDGEDDEGPAEMSSDPEGGGGNGEGQGGAPSGTIAPVSTSASSGGESSGGSSASGSDQGSGEGRDGGGNQARRSRNRRGRRGGRSRRDRGGRDGGREDQPQQVEPVRAGAGPSEGSDLVEVVEEDYGDERESDRTALSADQDGSGAEGEASSRPMPGIVVNAGAPAVAGEGSRSEFREQRDRLRRIKPKPKSAPKGPRVQAKIEELLKEGQEVLVQVAKDPIATKGARLTCHISLPGRHLVCMPTIDHVGVSRRIENDGERRKLREFVERNRTKKLGFIVRTASGKNSAEKRVKQDIDYLTRLWDQIRERAAAVSAPALVYEDLNAILRAIRDWVSEDIDRIIVDSRFHFNDIQRFASHFMPALKPKVELYQGSAPIFDAYGISAELARSLERKVWLKSGGYIVIDQAEALVAVDVNTGRYVGKKNLEDTILKTNLEAVQEIAYQLRLRNCGGIIILDLIDMEKEENKRRVYQALEEVLKKDRARPTILKISELGLIEMTRKRTRDTMVRTLCESCSHCEGKGYIKTKQTVGYEILRDIEREGSSSEVDKILVQAHPDIIDAMAIEERDTLDQLERRYRKQIFLQAVPDHHPEQYEVTTEVRDGAVRKTAASQFGRDRDRDRGRGRRRSGSKGESAGQGSGSSGQERGGQERGGQERGGQERGGQERGQRRGGQHQQGGVPRPPQPRPAPVIISTSSAAAPSANGTVTPVGEDSALAQIRAQASQEAGVASGNSEGAVQPQGASDADGGDDEAHRRRRRRRGGRGRRRREPRGTPGIVVQGSGEGQSGGGSGPSDSGGGSDSGSAPSAPSGGGSSGSVSSDPAGS